MAFGFPASYTAEIELVGSRQGAREATVGIFQALAWKYEAIGPDLYKVRMSMNPSSWGEDLTVTLTSEGTAIVTSKCLFPLQIFDGGQNKRNVEQFTARFSIREVREAKLDYKDPPYLDDKGRTPVDRVIVDGEAEQFPREKTE